MCHDLVLPALTGVLKIRTSHHWPTTNSVWTQVTTFREEHRTLTSSEGLSSSIALHGSLLISSFLKQVTSLNDEKYCRWEKSNTWKKEENYIHVQAVFTNARIFHSVWAWNQAFCFVLPIHSLCWDVEQRAILKALSHVLHLFKTFLLGACFSSSYNLDCFKSNTNSYLQLRS